MTAILPAVPARSMPVRTFRSTAVPQPRPVSIRRRVRPRATVDLSRLTRYRGGTYSHTVERIFFADGSSANTDLIRLNPGIQAYSLDYSGVSPLRPSPYRVQSFAEVPNLRARAYEIEVDWILRNSFPTLSVADLSGRVRDAGFPLGAGHISEHQAIAATQAAIWQLTNGLDLDTQPRNVPTRLSRGPREVTAQFDSAPELAGFTVDVQLSEDAQEAVTVSLYKSTDGRHWEQVAAASVQAEVSGSYQKSLGVGATLASHRYGQGRRGYQFYRLVVSGPATISNAAFELAGSGTYRNSAKIVHLYNYLLDGAKRARAASVAPTLRPVAGRSARSGDGLVGPFRLQATSPAALAADGVDLVTETGAELDGPVEVGTTFYVRPGRESATARAATVTMTVPGTRVGHGGRVLTGVARDGQSDRLTPVALVVPTEWVVDFDINW